MPLTITQIQDKIAPKMQGSSLSKLQGTFYDKCREAAGNVIARTNPLETIRLVRIEQAIYSHVYNYAVSPDVKGDNSVIDIRPVSERSRQDDINARGNREFDIRRTNDTFAVEVINGIKTLRLSKQVGQHQVLATLDAITGVETVTGSGDVVNITSNVLEKISGQASVQFGLSGATGVGAVSIGLPRSIDLSRVENVGSLFNWLQFPNAERLTNMVFKWGTDANNYFYTTITSPHDRATFESGAFTLQRADWVSALKAGTPVASNINFLEVQLNYVAGAALANVRLDNITAATGEAYELMYYSDRFFKSPTGDYLQQPTSGDDTINIGGDGENIFLYELMLIIIQELGEKSLAYSAKWLNNQLYPQETGLYARYNKSFPTKVLPITQTYHNFGYD